MNTALLPRTDTAPLPEQVVTNWRRFSSGLWRVPEGDISAAYSAECFPKVRTFIHDGRLFTNCGGCFGGPILAEMNCYRLVPTDEYSGPEPRQYTYEGREAAYRGQVFRLGPKVLFAASDPTIEEWRRLLRVLYADGGMFAKGCRYSEFLANRFTPKSENGRKAWFEELAECGGRVMPRTQEEMCGLLEAGASGSSEQHQIELCL